MGTGKQERFARWVIPGHDQEIEISAPLAAEIVAAAKAGFNRFPRGGLEVGGVLFGVREEGRLQVCVARPIPCKHTLGPSFTLTADEHDELADRLAAFKDDPELAGLVPVGWYHSHTRSGLLLSDADCHLHNRHFPHSWQIALLVRPEAGRPAELGVFLRRPDEELPQRPALVINEEALLAPESVEEGEDEQPVEEEPAGEIAWQWRRLARGTALATGLAVAALGAFRLGQRLPILGAALAAHWDRVESYWTGPAAPAAARPFSLSLASRGEQLIIRWNAAGGPGRGEGASLAVWDGELRREFRLDAGAFARGEFRWERHSERVTVRLTGAGSDGRPLRETAYFVGPWPAGPVRQAPPAVLPALKSDKDQLEIALRLQKAEADGLAQRLAALEMALQARAAAPRPPEPAKPAVVIAQKSPEPAPVPPALIQRPEAAPPPAAGAAASPGGAAPAVAQSGRLLWTGALAPGRILTIPGRQAFRATCSSTWRQGGASIVSKTQRRPPA